MLRQARIAFVALLVLTVLTGLAYPLAITAIARLVFPGRAGGSLIEVGGVVRGSQLVGQDWRGERWFHGRPSATGPDPYTPLPSTGSNLGPTSSAQEEALSGRAAALRKTGVTGPLPVDLLTASASGLDPHVSPDAARLQIDRVAHARGLEPSRVRALVEEHVEERFLGVLGEPRVNVLELNLALEELR